jgi:hypothetical protein
MAWAWAAYPRARVGRAARAVIFDPDGAHASEDAATYAVMAVVETNWSACAFMAIHSSLTAVGSAGGGAVEEMLHAIAFDADELDQEEVSTISLAAAQPLWPDHIPRLGGRQLGKVKARTA